MLEAEKPLSPTGVELESDMNVGKYAARGYGGVREAFGAAHGLPVAGQCHGRAGRGILRP
jgi:hypothetical protein